MLIRTFAALALSALLAVACSEAAAQTVNDKCPMMEGEVDPNEPTFDWNGHTVGFCCGGCSEKFAALDEAEKLAKLTKVGAKLEQ